MKNIYSSARRVVVWLGGDHNGQAAEAVDIIKKAAHYCSLELGKPISRIDTEDFRNIEQETFDSPKRTVMIKRHNFAALPEWGEMGTPSPWTALAWFFDRNTMNSIASTIDKVFQNAWISAQRRDQRVSKPYQLDPQRIYIRTDAKTLRAYALMSHDRLGNDYSAIDSSITCKNS